MTIRTILAAAGGGLATAGTLDLACLLARRFDAHLEALHVRPDQQAVYASMGESLGGPGSAALVESLVAQAADNAAQARAAFDAIVARHGLTQGAIPQFGPSQLSAIWREEAGSAAAAVAERGRFFDLVVLGCSDRVAHEPHSDTIEETLLGCGRPVLLAPVAPPDALGDRVAIAWNGSPPAVRALAAALPFLLTASGVVLLTAGDPDVQGTEPALDYLRWHGITAEAHTLDAGSARHVGRALLDAAKDARADLMVMGAYGHAPWREQLFGGATRAVLATMPLPLLLMH